MTEGRFLCVFGGVEGREEVHIFFLAFILGAFDGCVKSF